MTTIGVYNIKGGVGKSTTAVNLACLAGRGGATLLWDLDPQGAAGYYLGQSADEGKGSGRLVRGKDSLRDLCVPTRFPGLDLIPARFSYRRLDLHLQKRAHPRNVLAKLLAPLARDYRWVFLDCPPGITLLSENVFRAVDLLLVPVIPTPLSLRTFEEIVVFYQRKGLDRARVLPFFSLVERRKRIHRATMEVFAAREGRVCRSSIPSLSDIESMALTRRPVSFYRPRSEAGRVYAALWDEVRADAEALAGSAAGEENVVKKPKRADSLENVPKLLRELSLLRTRVDESAEQFSLAVKARIDEIVHALASVEAPDAGHVLPDPRLVTKMVHRLKSLEQRPTRGRAKDLKRISDLVSFLSEALLSRE